MKQIISSIIGVMLCVVAIADNGLVTVKSNHDVATTADNLERVLNEKGMTVFARIDHAKGANSVDIELRPTVVVIFGNPKVGSPLMQCQQSVAIDLPQKASIFKDAGSDIWLTYNDPAYLSERHGLEDCAPVLEKISGALANFAKAATQ